MARGPLIRAPEWSRRHDRAGSGPVDTALQLDARGAQLVQRSYEWQSNDWPGVQLHGQVVYELHLGTFTPQGTWAAACEKLPYLKDVGVTLIEIMPVADFNGEFGWGYDGVAWFAPCRAFACPYAHECLDIAPATVVAAGRELAA